MSAENQSSAPSLPRGKKRKIPSGLTGVQLFQTYTALDQALGIFLTCPTNEELDDSDVDVKTKNAFLERLTSLRDDLGKKMGSRKDISFSCAKEDMVATYLRLKTGLTFGSKNLDQSIIDTKVASSNNQAYMSSEQFLMHLTMIENSVPPINEAASRVRIDAFLFRLHAMCPNDHYTMFNLDMYSQALSAEAVHQKPSHLQGYIDYTIILSSIKAKNSFIPNLNSGASLKIINLKGACPKPVAFFVLEGKTLDHKLVNHIPQAQLELYACAQQLGVSIIRGCLSSGREWIFLYLQLAEDGEVYFRSSVGIRYTVDWNWDNCHMSIARGKNDPNHISILLDHWVKNSQKALTAENDGEFFFILDDPNQPKR